MTVTIAVSFAALIFVSPIDGWMSYGSELMVFTAVVAGLGMFLFSSFPGTIAIPEDRIAPILALMAALIIQTMGSGAAPQARGDDRAGVDRDQHAAGGTGLLSPRSVSARKYRPLFSASGDRRLPRGFGLVAGGRLVPRDVRDPLEPAAHGRFLFVGRCARVGAGGDLRRAALRGLALGAALPDAAGADRAGAGDVLRVAAHRTYFGGAGARQRVAAGDRGKQGVSPAQHGFLSRAGRLERNRDPGRWIRRDHPDRGDFHPAQHHGAGVGGGPRHRPEPGIARGGADESRGRAGWLHVELPIPESLAAGVGNGRAVAAGRAFLRDHLRDAALARVGSAQLHPALRARRHPAIPRHRVSGRMGLGCLLRDGAGGLSARAADPARGDAVRLPVRRRGRHPYRDGFLRREIQQRPDREGGAIGRHLPQHGGSLAAAAKMAADARRADSYPAADGLHFFRQRLKPSASHSRAHGRQDAAEARVHHP